MRDRLFSIVEGEPIVTAPLINLGPFKSLWDEDLSDDKSDYKKWLLYIYYISDYRSDLYDVKNRNVVAMTEVFGKVVKTTPTVEACIKTYIEYNCVAEQRALEAAINSGDSMCDTLTDLQQESKALKPLLDAMEKEIASLVKSGDLESAADMMGKKFSLQEKQLVLASKAADLIPKIEKNVVAMINIREKVESAMSKIGDDNKLETFIIDDLIANRENNENNYLV